MLVKYIKLSLQTKKKTKSESMVVNAAKIFQKLKKKDWLSIEKIVMTCKK